MTITLNYLTGQTSFTMSADNVIFSGGQITLDPISTDNPTAMPSDTIRAESISFFYAGVTAAGSDSITFTMEVDGTETYFDGSAWVDSAGYAESNTAAEINAALATLTPDDYDFEIRPVTYLHSDDGLTTPILNSMAIIYDPAIYLITDVGGTDSNSYTDVAFIDQYVKTCPHDATWGLKTTKQKRGFALAGARWTDHLMEWEGLKTSSEQALDHPRTGLYDKNGIYIDSNTIAIDVKNAQAEFSRLLAVSDLTADQGQEMSGMGVGTLNISYFKTRKDWPKDVMPDSVYEFLRYYGNKTGNAAYIKVYRS